jgi:predicted alpha/beta-hydrolase family hydrolase
MSDAKGRAEAADKTDPVDKGGARGFLHHPAKPNGHGLVLSHGAGSDCTAPLLVVVANAFAAAGLAVLRCDLEFRQKRPKGPPFPAAAAGDRESLRKALSVLKEFASGRLYLAGHSYGGRQASMLAADEPELAAGLLLLSYPLHPPNKPEQMRTAHFAKLRTPVVFVSGTADGFGSTAELEAALKLIPAPSQLISIEGAGHDLKKGRFNLAPIVTALIGEA